MNSKVSHKNTWAFSRVILLCILSFMTTVGWSQEPYVDSLKVVLKKSERDDLKVHQLSNIAEYYFNRGIYMDSSFYYSQRAYDKALAIEDNKQAARALVNLGLIESELNNFDTALAHFLEARELVLQQELQVGLSVIHSNLGGLYFKKEEFANSIVNYEEAIAISKKANDSIGMGIDYINLGDVEFEAGIYKDAREDLEYGMALLESLGYELGIAYTNYAETLWALEQTEKAREAALKALAIGKEEKDAQVISDASLTLSQIFRLEEDYPQALAYYKLGMEQKYVVNTAKEENEIEKLKLNLKLSNTQAELERANQRSRYQNIIYILLGLGVLLLLLLISRQVKVRRMKAQIYEVQRRLFSGEAEKAQKKKKFFAARYASREAQKGS